jgi:2'-5' RNA ligase
MLSPACAKVKWVEEENIHLTVKFLGDVADKDVPAIKEALAGVPFAPMVFRISGFGAFPGMDRPRVIWAGLEPGEVIVELHEEVESALTGLGFQKDRDFSPHLTIGRVRDVSDLSLFSEFFSSVRPLANEQTFRIEALRLKRSVLTPSGPVYSDVASFGGNG